MSIITLLKTTQVKALLLIGIGFLVWGGFIFVGRGLQNRLTVENRSGQYLLHVIVGVAGSSQAIMFERIPDGASISAPFKIRGDSDFHVYGKLGDNTAFSWAGGYVTSGLTPEYATFVIKPGGKIDFTQSH